MNVSVLGTNYDIIKVDPYDKILGQQSLADQKLDGMCDSDLKLIYIVDLKKTTDWKFESDNKIHQRESSILRHEIVHAFLNESGLRYDCFVFDGSWATNEEMVDWIANQGVKIYQAWKSVNCC